MDRKEFLKSLVPLAAVGVALPSFLAKAETGACETPACSSDAKAVRNFLSDFLVKEEANLDHPTLVKLMEERGRSCCRTLSFRQKLIKDSAGSMDRLVELMGKIVAPGNCVREGDLVTLIYTMGKCGCTLSPERPPVPNDPYCECSKANNQLLFETVAGKPVRVEVTESPRRGGKVCRFLIHLA